jgi:hypothetical protein
MNALSQRQGYVPLFHFTQMKKLKYLLVCLIAVFAFSCTEETIVKTGDDDEVIIIPPPKPKPTTAATDSI